ncbi:beta strand repeat-containing protein [Novosphingobium aquiterrae]
MRRTLLATTAVLALAAPAMAETVITAKRTTTINTSTANNGAADSIRIGSAGSIEITSGTAITVDSNNAATVEGKIIVSNAPGGAGIVVNAGTSGDIVVATTGSITVDEPYTATDTDNDGDLDGPFAVGANRYGIRTLGAHTGKVTQSGTILVEGNDSAGIWLGGSLTGNFTHDGKTTVIGDRAVGIRADAINGSVRLAGQVSAIGVGAVGARFTGDVSGAMVVQGAITSTGYRYTTVPADPSKLDADDLLQGGSALMIEGNVAGGIILAIPPRDTSSTDNDEDRDGIEDSKEGSASVVTYGAAPAMVVGATDHAIAIGPIAGTGTGFGLQIDGAVAGNGLYSGIAGNGLVIGGRGGAVTIAGGIGISGTVSAASNGASATAVRIGSGASVPEVRNSGTVSSSGGGTATSVSSAVLIEAGASVATVRNSGAIKASASGAAGTAVAIADRTGQVALIENSGTISATGAQADSGRNIAIDLSANTAGATIRQTVVAAGIAAPSITGDVLLGSGDDLFDIADGSVTGIVTLGSGNDRLTLGGDATLGGKVLFGAGNDTLTLAGTSAVTAIADFAGGGTDSLTIANSARFAGTMVNAGQLAVTMTGGSLELVKPTTIGSLTTASGSTLLVILDKDVGEGTAITVNGIATIASGTNIKVQLADVANAEGRYTFLTAGTLVGGTGLVTNTDLVPFIYKAALATNAPSNQLAIDIARKSATELGLNQSESAAWNAAYAAIGGDAELGKVFLNTRDGEVFRTNLDQMLPDHAGGTFRAISLGARSMGRQIADPVGPIKLDGNLQVNLGLSVWGTSKDKSDSIAYDIKGMGGLLGAECQTGLGYFGADLTWLWSQTYNGLGVDNTVKSNTYMIGAHWRVKSGGFQAFARGGIGIVRFDSERAFSGATATSQVRRTTSSKWNGTLTTFGAGASIEGGGRYFYFRPSVGIDYVRLSEDGHTETGGGTGLNLTIDKRSGSELAAEGGLVLGIDFSGTGRDDSDWIRVEVEGGRREILSGKLAATTAKFGSGTPFILLADQSRSGWYSRLRALGGTSDYQFGGEVGAEDANGQTAYSIRGTLRIQF